jgi:hypothetical protein
MTDQVQNAEAAAPVVAPASETTTAPAAEQATTQENGGQLPDGIMRRFGELTAARRAAEERAAQLEAQLAQFNTQQQAPQDTTQMPLNNANVEQLVNSLAEQRIAERLAQQRVQERVQSIEAAGREKYGEDFDRSVTHLQMAGIGGQPFIDALTSVKGSESVVRYLGDTANIDEALRIAQLPPVQMALAISELAPKAAKQYSKPISSAPAPLNTLDGARGTSPDGEPSPKDTKAWIAWRANNARKR